MRLEPTPVQAITADDEQCAVRRDVGHTTTVEVIRDVEKFSSYRDQWNSIAEQSSATIFQTHEWLFLWWKHLGTGGNRTLHTLIVRNKQLIVGIIPLFLEVYNVFGFRLYKRLRLLGSGVADRYSYTAISESGPSDFLDFIALPQFQSLVAEAFVNYIGDHPFICDEILFENIPDESIVKKDLLPWMDAADIRYEIRRTDICPRLITPSSVEQFLRRVHPSVRRRLLQAQKAFSRGSIYELETMTSEKLPGAFRDLVELHQQRWNRLGYPGVFHDTRFRDFQQDVLQAFWNNGWIWFKSLRTGSVRIASRMGFKFNDRIYDYLSGFDDHPPWSKLRPGLALLLTMIEDAVASKSICVELLRGNEQYKFELTSEFVTNSNIRFFTSNGTRTLRSAVFHMSLWFEYSICQFSKQRLLFRVQYREHGLPVSIFHYVSFQCAKLNNKVSSRLKKFRQGREERHQPSLFPDKKL
ncbi:MAG TPA: GNAT family N-acetyltransferase [Bacteroidota bacterium]|nr:GNAT family N-acetyltransferase [Bacteroidota bacterium]